LKDDATPTIFIDSKPTKVRKTQERKQKIEKKEVSKCLLFSFIDCYYFNFVNYVEKE
jgi:hypothetical protein